MNRIITGSKRILTLAAVFAALLVVSASAETVSAGDFATARASRQRIYTDNPGSRLPIEWKRLEEARGISRPQAGAYASMPARQNASRPKERLYTDNPGSRLPIEWKKFETARPATGSINKTYTGYVNTHRASEQGRYTDNPGSRLPVEWQKYR